MLIESQIINQLAVRIHQANQKWWVDLETGQPLNRNKGELLMLVVSEIAEAMEGDRKDLWDDHIPTRKMIEVELADALIRIMDMSAAFGYDLGGALVEKLAYNAARKDHTVEARKQQGGKKY